MPRGAQRGDAAGGEHARGPAPGDPLRELQGGDHKNENENEEEGYPRRGAGMRLRRRKEPIRRTVHRMYERETEGKSVTIKKKKDVPDNPLTEQERKASPVNAPALFTAILRRGIKDCFLPECWTKTAGIQTNQLGKAPLLG